MLLRHTLVFLVVASAASVALAQRGRGGFSEDRLLDEVVRANQNLKARGTRTVYFRFKRDGKSSSVEFTENVIRDGVRSRIETFRQGEKEASIAVDDGKFRYHYNPKANVINKYPSLQHQNSERLEVLMRENRKSFRIDVDRSEKIADQATYLITLKDDKGNEHKIWVERGRKAILRREFKWADSDNSSYWSYSSFNYLTTVSPSEFTINKPAAKVVEPLDRLRTAVSTLQFRTYRIVGDSKYQLYDASIMESKEDGNVTKFLRSTYGDGQHVLSLFQVRGDLDESKLRRREGYEVHVWKRDGYSFALIGGLTKQELERLGALVRR